MRTKLFTLVLFAGFGGQEAFAASAHGRKEDPCRVNQSFVDLGGLPTPSWSCSARVQHHERWRAFDKKILRFCREYHSVRPTEAKLRVAASTVEAGAGKSIAHSAVTAAGEFYDPTSAVNETAVGAQNEKLKIVEIFFQSVKKSHEELEAMKKEADDIARQHPSCPPTNKIAPNGQSWDPILEETAADTNKIWHKGDREELEKFEEFIESDVRFLNLKAAEFANQRAKFQLNMGKSDRSGVSMDSLGSPGVPGAARVPEERRDGTPSSKGSSVGSAGGKEDILRGLGDGSLRPPDAAGDPSQSSPFGDTVKDSISTAESPPDDEAMNRNYAQAVRETQNTPRGERTPEQQALLDEWDSKTQTAVAGDFKPNAKFEPGSAYCSLNARTQNECAAYQQQKEAAAQARREAARTKPTAPASTGAEDSCTYARKYRQDLVAQMCRSIDTSPASPAAVPAAQGRDSCAQVNCAGLVDSRGMINGSVAATLYTKCCAGR